MRNEEGRSGGGRRLVDCLVLGSGLAGVLSGFNKILHNPSEHFNFINESGQYIYGSIEMVLAGSVLAYGVDRFLDRYSKQE